MIEYGRQHIDDDDIAAVVEVLRSPFLTQGTEVPRFEAALADYCGVDHAVAVNSATSALHVACLALGAAPGKLVWTSAVSFVASANCALYCGADIDFVDIDPGTFNLSLAALEAKLATAERPPDILIPVHLGGLSCDMRRLAALADTWGFHILEDASHALGATFAGAPVGRCSYSDITVFSFHPVKMITTAEGGAALTDIPEFADRMRRLRSHGITRDPALMGASDGGWYYEQVELGFNYRMSDLHAALGTSQLTKLDRFVDRRHALRDNYDHLLGNLPLARQPDTVDCRSSLHILIVTLDPGIDHASAYAGLRERGIGVNLHYIPIPNQPWYRALGFDPAHYPAANDYYGRALTLPLYPDLREEEQTAVAAALEQVLCPA